MARILGPKVYGLILGLQLIFQYGIHVHLGTLNSLNREIPLNRGKGRLDIVEAIRNTTLVSVLFSGIITFILLFIGSFFVKANMDRIGVRFFSLFLFLMLIMFYFQFLFRTEYLFERLSILKIVQSFFMLVLVVGGTYFFKFYGYLAGYGAGLFVFTVIHYFIYPDRKKLKLKFDFNIYKKLLKIGIPILISGIIGSFIFSIDRVFVLSFFGKEKLGFYALAILLMRFFYNIPLSIHQVFYPNFSEIYGKTGNKKDLLPYIVKPAIFFVVAVSFVSGVGYFLLDPAVRLILPKYIKGIKAGTIILFALPFQSIWGFGANFLLATTRERLNMIINGIFLAVESALIFIFITVSHHINQVALALVIFYFLVANFFFVFIPYDTGSSLKGILKILIPINLPVLLVFLFVKGSSLINVHFAIKIVIFLILYFLFILLLNKHFKFTAQIKRLLSNKKVKT